ncbi:MAG: DUF29 domain-containing protein [Cyanobacteriota bacterium]|nr:DUF29 domain-containing protein [Cyanobacteriota bacterium]
MTAQTSLYNQDYYLWSQKMAALLRSHHWEQLDIDHIAEEIESLGRSERRALESNLLILIIHLLKWKYQPDKQTNSWKYTIREHRQRIDRELRESPSLKPYLAEVFSETYENARQLAADETGLDILIFPPDYPFSIEDVLNPDFLPNYVLDQANS